MSERDPEDVEAYEAEPAKVTVGNPAHNSRRVEIHEYDPGWPRLHEREEARMRAALGDLVVRLEHAGPTSVPGLPRFRSGLGGGCSSSATACAGTSASGSCTPPPSESSPRANGPSSSSTPTPSRRWFEILARAGPPTAPE